MDGDLPWGRTLDEIIKMASYVAHGNRYRALDYEEARQAAAVAMLEVLYASAGPPSATRLFDAARAILGHHVDQHMRDHGDDRTRPGQGQLAKGWLRFWVNPPGEPFDERVTDRIAVWEVFWQLSENDREALWALAVTGDWRDAALWAGCSYGTFVARMASARRHARHRWFWPEPPAPQWGHDRRKHSKNKHTVMQQRRGDQRRKEREAS